MNIFLFFFFMLYGICIGSFLNVIAYRVPKEISVIKGRSMCPTCGHVLGILDLIPVFSYLFLGRKCRYCKTPISGRYAFGELLTGILFGICGVRFGFSIYAAAVCLFLCALIVAAFVDYDNGYIPDEVHIFILAAALISMLSSESIPILSRIFGALLIPAIMLLICKITHGGIGLGDIKLLAASGFFIGLKLSIPAFFLGYILACICLIPKMIKRQLHRTQEIPMAPYFAASLFILTIWGNKIIEFYFSLF